jgi:hypothetical protein
MLLKFARVVAVFIITFFRTLAVVQVFNPNHLNQAADQSPRTW